MGYRILSFDGGGIRGLFTTTLLRRIVQEVPKLIESADLLAGTSTGGIIAVGLASGFSPGALSSMYRENAKKIFDDSVWDELLDLGNAVGADYELDGLKELLQMGFGNKTLGDIQKRVLVPTFDLDAPATQDRPRTWKPKFFHNYPGPGSDAAERLVDVLMRTSAAPTYFPTHQGYIDGGVIANNPSMAAVAQAVDAKAGGAQLSDVRLLSFGTGQLQKHIAGDRHDWGWGQWARPMIELMITGTMGVADYQVKQMLGPRYRRVDAYLPKVVELDATDGGSLDALEQAAMGVELGPTIEFLKNVWLA